MVVDKNDKLNKDIKILDEKNRQLETVLKAKQLELIEAMKRLTESESKVLSSDEQAK